MVNTSRGREMTMLMNEREKCEQILKRLESVFIAEYGYLCESVELPDYGNSPNRRMFDSLVTGRNPYKKENKVRYNNCFYRSKLEADFARIMDEHGVPFKYEPEITVYNGRHRYPDFVLYLPWLDIIILVEIYGKCDDPDYLVSVRDRQYEYMMSGWKPGINMLSYYYYDKLPYLPEMVMEDILNVEERNYMMTHSAG